MKKLSALLGLIITASFMSACGNQNMTSLPLNQQIQPAQEQETSIQSRKGLSSFYTALTSNIFFMLDQNKDKALSIDEFRMRPNVALGITGSPQSSDSQQVSASSIFGRKVDTKNPDSVFKAVDRNKDNRIDLKEAQKSKYFLGADKKELRKTLAEPIFNSWNKDRNKTISKGEFETALTGYDTNLRTALTGMFFAADRNKDNNLTFSEFEDLLYASFKATWETAQNNTPNQPTTPAYPSDPGTPDYPSDPSPNYPVSPDQPYNPDMPDYPNDNIYN